MPELQFPFLTLAFLLPLAAAFAVAWLPAHLRRGAAIAAVALSALGLAIAATELAASGVAKLAEPWISGLFASSPLTLDALGAFALLSYALVALILMVAAPARDSQPADLRDYLLMFSGAALAYSADHLLLLLAGWSLSILPVVLGKTAADARVTPRFPLPRIALLLSTASLAAALVLIASGGASGSPWLLSLSQLSSAPASASPVWTITFLMLAVLLRKGVFPFHSWVPMAAETGSPLKTVLLMNSHLGAFLVARLALPLLPVASAEALRPLADLALVTALVASLMAVVEKQPRRLVASLTVSQASFILAGIGSGTSEGITGALVYWVVVAVGSSVIFLVLRMLELRAGTALSVNTYHGFAAKAPRLAAFFAVSALAMVGLPGTLGFCAEDLLLHGTLAAQPIVGLLLPLATALNAVSFLRLFNRLFLGKPLTQVIPLADALPRERLALSAAVLILVGLGIVPGAFVRGVARTTAPIKFKAVAPAHPIAKLIER